LTEILFLLGLTQFISQSLQAFGVSSISEIYENRILSALPEETYHRLLPHLESVDLNLGDVLYEVGEPISEVYFPLGTLISLVSPVDHTSREFGLVGNEGMVGIPALLGGESTISRATVQVADSALKMDATVLKAEFEGDGVLRSHLLLYIQWMLTQSIQNAACQAHHATESRLARWLLSIQDRLGGDQLWLTQKYIAELLGTRRATITDAAGGLQKQGLIHYRRGSITLLNQVGLEARACECYALLRQEYERLQALAQTLS
jgi:CRP-like cAMP-binding protein